MDSYSKGQIETALFEQGFNILQEVGSLVLYQKNVFPAIDLIIDWSQGTYEWQDLQAQLEYQGINTKIFYDRLCDLVPD